MDWKLPDSRDESNFMEHVLRSQPLYKLTFSSMCPNFIDAKKMDWKLLDSDDSVFL